MRPASLSRTLRVSALALGLAATGDGLHGEWRKGPAGRPVRGMEVTVPEGYEAPVADGAASRGGVSDADDWLG